MWKDARLAVGMSQEELSMMAMCRREDIIDVEKGRKEYSPDQALRASKALKAPHLTAKYCSQCCAIGNLYCYDIEKKSLYQTVLQLLDSLNNVDQYRKLLTAIARDGIITPDELEHARECTLEFMMLEKDIEEFKLAMADVVDIPDKISKINAKEKQTQIFKPASSKVNVSVP